MSDMQTGTVKFFSPERGYGFIQPTDGGQDVFVHVSIAESAGIQLVEGLRLEFESFESARGLKAANLKLA